MSPKVAERKFRCDSVLRIPLQKLCAVISFRRINFKRKLRSTTHLGYKWTGPCTKGTYRLYEQRRLWQAWACTQTRPSLPLSLTQYKMSHVTRKPVLGGWRPDKFQTGLLSFRNLIEFWIFYLTSIGMILYKQRTTKALIRLRGCAGWSEPLLFAYGIKQVSSWHGSNNSFTVPGMVWFVRITSSPFNRAIPRASGVLLLPNNPRIKKTIQ